MSTKDPVHLTRELLAEYFLRSAKPRDEWRVGMEVEKMGREVEGGRPIPFESEGASVRKVLEFIHSRRGGDPVHEAEHLIGLDAPWGSISLEPGGQVEWSSRPHEDLVELREQLEAHLRVMREAGEELGIRWLDVGVDPVHSVTDMPWMPKARYSIMRPYLGERGALAHRMMTQSASIQAAFDYEDAADWASKFKAAVLLTPIAVALFANSSRIDGRESGYRSYRQVIWRRTDPARCGVPDVVFEPGFGVEAWLDYALNVPTMFLHRAKGLVPAGGVPFAELLARCGCNAVKLEDWESHLSTIFTDVRSYGYIEVRSADLQRDELDIAVPTFWTGLLYHPEARVEAGELVSGLDHRAAWNEALETAAREGLDGRAAGWKLRDLARRILAVSRRGLLDGATCAGDGPTAAGVLDDLAAAHGLGPLA